MEKQAIEEAEKEGETLPPGEIKLPMFKELQAKKRADAQKKFLEERVALENNLTDIEKQIQQIQKALNDVDGVQTIDSFFKPKAEPQKKPKPKEAESGKKRKSEESDDGGEGKSAGASGPGGDFVEFPEYDGEEEPNESKKAFTLFCKKTRKEVKKSLSPSERKSKVRLPQSIDETLHTYLIQHSLIPFLFTPPTQDHVNGILKDRWYALTEDEKHVWKEWEVWDAKRYEHQWELYENESKKSSKKAKSEGRSSTPPMKDGMAVPKKKRSGGGDLAIPKKRK